MKRLFLAAALALPASLAAAQTPPPAAPPAEGGGFEMSCAMFKHNADGSWHVTEPMTLQPASGPVPLKPSRNFRTGTLFGGFDLGAALDGACGQ